MVIANRRRWRLGHTAYHRRVGQTIDDRIADHVDVDVPKVPERLPEPVEGDAFGLHQHQELVDAQIGRAGLDDGGRRIDDVPGREEDFATIGG